jgi:hypothetical protein
MAEPLYQASFAAGELAPHLHARTDIAKYKAGAKVLRNFFVDYRGGATSRPGSLFVGLPKSQAGKPRLIPFKFNSQQTYVLVLDANHGMRIATNGGFVTEPALAITAGSNANPLTLTIPGHTYVNGDDAQINGVVGLARPNGVSGVNGRTLVVTNVSGNVVTFADPINGAIDATTWTAYSSGGTAARIYTVTHPWNSGDLFQLNYAQQADVIIAVNPNYVIYQISRLAANDWTIAPDVIGTTIARPLNVVGAALNDPGAPHFFISYVVTAVDDATGEESIASDPAGVVNGALNQNTGVANSLSWTPVTNATSYNIYKSEAVPNGDQGAGPYTYGLAGTSPQPSFVDVNYAADFTQVPPTAVNPFESGPVAAALIDQAGFGYISPQWVLVDPAGTGAAITISKDITGALTSAAVASAGDGYVAPNSYIVEGDTTLGTGLVMAFSGSFVASGGNFVPAPGSITITTPGTHYHVPVLSITATLAFNVLNSADTQGTLTFNAGFTHATISAYGANSSAGVRAVAGADSGKYYVEFQDTAFPGTTFGICTKAAIFGSLYGTLTGLVQHDPSNNSALTGYDGVACNFTQGYAFGNNNKVMINNVAQFSTPFVLGHLFAIAVDATAQKFWVKDLTAAGDWNQNPSADPATGVGGVVYSALSNTTIYLYNAQANGVGTSTSLGTWNFGGSGFTGTVPAGFTSGWPGPTSPVGTSGVYYLTTNGAIPVTLNTVTALQVPYTSGLVFNLSTVDTLPGAVILPSQATGHVQLAGQQNPSVVSFFDQRQAFAASTDDPDTFWLSRPGQYHNFDVSFPSQANDAITGTIVGQEVDAIQSLTPMASGLIALTSSGAYQISGGTPGAALTPTTVGAQAQAFSGANAQPPLRVNYDLLYQQARGSAVRDLSYNFYVNVYTGQDVSALSSHLFEGRTLLNWCYAEQPWYQILGVRDDGIMLSFTFLKEQELYGWSRYDTAGLYVAVATIPENGQDMVYAAVQRYLNGQFVYVIERFQNRLLGGNDALNIPATVEDAWSVDCGVSYPLTYPAANLRAVPSALGTIGTLDIVFGGTGYSGSASLLIQDPTGTGANFTLTVVAGVITNTTRVSGGSNYSNPTFTVLDSTGEGAVIVGPVQHLWSFTADSAVFAMGDVGKTIRAQGGVGNVTTYNSTTNIIADMTTQIAGLLPNMPGLTLVMMPAPQGQWSLTTPVSVIGGLDHANGSYVQIVADGNVIAPQIVADGCITLPVPASAIVAGFGFSCQLQTLRPDAGEPTIQGRRKTIPAFTIRVLQSRGLMIGPDFKNMIELGERTNAMAMGSPIPLDISGVVLSSTNGPQAQQPLAGSVDQRKPVSGDWTVDGYSCVMQTYPLPATILAIIPEIMVGDDPSP